MIGINWVLKIDDMSDLTIEERAAILEKIIRDIESMDVNSSDFSGCLGIDR